MLFLDGVQANGANAAYARFHRVKEPSIGQIMVDF